MLNSNTMHLQVQSFLVNISSQILDGKETINTKSELIDLVSIMKTVLEGNEYLKSKLDIDTIANQLPISKKNLDFYIYNSIGCILIENEDKLRKEMDNSLNKLINIVITERANKQYTEAREVQREQQRQEETSQPAVEEPQPIPQQLFYPEDVMQQQMPTQQIVPQAYQPYGQLYDNQPLGGRQVIYPIRTEYDDGQDAMREAFRRDQEEKDIRRAQEAAAAANAEETQPLSEYDRVKKILEAFKSELDEHSTYADKLKYIKEKALMYKSIYKDDSTKYFVENSETIKTIESLCSLIGEAGIRINVKSNKELLDGMSEFIQTDTNEGNVDRVLQCISLFDHCILTQIKSMNL